MLFERVRSTGQRRTLMTRLMVLGLFLSLLINAFGPLAPAGAAATSGGVLAWGDNRSDQLGLAATGAQRAAPGPVSAALNSGITAIASGSNHSLALRQDGTVLTWGSNFPSGQTGQGSTADRLDPAPVQGVSGVTAIASGYLHSLAVSGGNVYTWGDDNYGQLGNAAGDTCNSGACNRSAVQVGGLSDVKSVGAGARHSLAVKNDGSVYAWGINHSGALGDGSTTQRDTPVQVKGVGGTGTLGGVVAVTGGEGHSLALKGDGTVWAWGQNSQGQLGIGAFDNNNHPTPAQVNGLTNIIAIAAGYRHSMALRADGAVFTWGNNDSGQIGNGVTPNGSCQCVVTPYQVAGVAGGTAIGAGASHSLAVLNDGTVRAWGLNGSTQGGVESPTELASPVTVPGLAHATAVDGGNGHSIVLQTAPQVALTVGTNGGGTGTVTPGSGSYAEGAQVTLKAEGTNGSIFVGWTIDGQIGGWANPLTLTMDQNHSVIATFNKPTEFCDVNTNDLYFAAIQQLSARGVIRGFEREDGQLCFAPNDGTKRAQMAALIARPLGWDTEDHGNPFSDQGQVDGNLWRNVGTLAHYNVARGYKPETCQALGVGTPCYGPTDEVVYAQVVSFITRGMVAKGYWTYQPDNGFYPNVPGDSGHRVDIATYLHYVGGALPGADSPAQPWDGYASPAPRGWFAEVLWRALDAQFGLNRTS
ncbi:MAG TPA: S-layer homology domain-containing protein [Thermomicrobiales bacterium]